MEQKPTNAQNAFSDQQSAQMVHQAIRDDQALSASADDILVTVKNSAITLDGKVADEQQMNLVANTAAAVGRVEGINNRMVIKGKRSAARRSRKHRDAKRIFQEKKPPQEPVRPYTRTGGDRVAVSEEIKKDPAPSVRFFSLSNLHSAVSTMMENSLFPFLKKGR